MRYMHLFSYISDMGKYLNDSSELLTFMLRNISLLVEKSVLFLLDSVEAI